jgi:hypothetical protein
MDDFSFVDAMIYCMLAPFALAGAVIALALAVSVALLPFVLTVECLIWLITGHL